jgi:Sec-independent protein translocase protein TatA
LFGVGPQELLIIGLLIIVVLGPLKAVGMARELGRFVTGANRTVEEFKDELLTEEVKEVRSSAEALKSEIASGEGQGGGDK